MPHDYLIKESEIGNEMFFLTEGLVEVIIKKANAAHGVIRTISERQFNQDGNNRKRPFNLVLKKGDFFGEVSNNKFSFSLV